MTCQFDPLAPEELKFTQKWFASIITARLTPDNEIQTTTPSGGDITEEAKGFITPSHALLPHERIQIYNQCYWARLLDLLEETFPLVARLFGAYDFRQILAIPYFLQCSMENWNLNEIGDSFPLWIKEHYTATDKRLVLYSARCDWAFEESFFIPDFPPIEIHNMSESELAGILQKKMRLQAHVHLFELPYNLFSYREAFLKEKPDYWLENDFPKLEREKAPYFFVVFRNLQHFVEYKELSASEFLLLQHIDNGKTLEEACETLENSGDEIYAPAMENLGTWIQEWFNLKYFAYPERE